MTLPLLTPPGTAPSRSQTAEQFNANADAFVSWLATLVSQWNGTVPDLNELIPLVQPAIDAATTALQAPGTMANSTSSVTLPTALPANLSFTIEPGKLLVAGMTLDAIATTVPDNHVVGKIVSYNSSTGALVLRATVVEGSGTWSSWTLSLAPLPLTTTRNPLVPKTTSFTLAGSDKGSVFNCTVNLVISFPTDLADLGTDFYCYVFNEAATASILVNDNGGAQLRTLRPKTGALLVCDGTNIRILDGDGKTARSSTRGLVGNANLANPATRFDLTATSVVLTNAVGHTIAMTGLSTYTCNLSTAGPAVNGRDQAAVFPANSWVHLYFISTGTGVALIASLNAPSMLSGPVLPTGYTYWAYATTIRWNASSNIVPVFVQGATVIYEILQSVLTNGVATAWTTLSLGSFVPPMCRRAMLALTLFYAGAATVQASLRPTGLATTGTGANAMRAASIAGQTVLLTNTHEAALSAYQQLDYILTATPPSNGFHVDVIGYNVPNGDN